MEESGQVKPTTPIEAKDLHASGLIEVKTQKPPTYLGNLRQVNSLIDSKRRKQFLGILFITVIASLFEVVSIAIVYPYLNLAFNNVGADLGFVEEAFSVLGVNFEDDALLWMTVLLSVVFIIAAAMKLYVLNVSTKFTFSIGNDVASKLFNRSLRYPYIAYSQINTNTIIDALTVKSRRFVAAVVIPLVSTFTAVTILISVALFLLWKDPLIAIIAFSGFCFIYGIVIEITNKRLRVNGEVISEGSTAAMQIARESLKSVKDLRLYSLIKERVQQFKKVDLSTRMSLANSAFIGSSPRYLIEGLGVCFFGCLVYVLSKRELGGNILPTLGMLVVAGQKVLPFIQQTFTGWSSMKSAEVIIEEYHNLLGIGKSGSTGDMSARHQIEDVSILELKNTTFFYPESENPAIEGINAVINKGEIIGITGPSGGGKSTFCDVLMGFLSPTDGEYFINGCNIKDIDTESLQKKISLVPQSIFYLDAKIYTNITFKEDYGAVDKVKLKKVLRITKLEKFLNQLPDGVRSHIGEDGGLLSGGQKQRIGIARALYHSEEVLFMDEATNALDASMESDVIKSIKSSYPDITIFLVTHRRENLRHVDRIFEFHNGTLTITGPVAN